ncbi:MAG: hypothetical protein ACO2OQ_01100 [Thermofilaceae archaeon]
MRRALALALTLALLLSWLEGAVAQPAVTVRKSILRTISVCPGSEPSTSITVTLFFDAEGMVNFTDTLAYAQCGEITATTPPSYVACPQGMLRASWLGYNASPGEALKYTVPGLSLLNVGVELSTEKGPLNLSCEDGYCRAVALGVHQVNYTLHLSLSEHLPRGVQLPVSVSWGVDPVYLYPIAFSESPQSLRESGTEISFQWTVFVNGSYTLSVVFEVRGENPWGEVVLPQPVITASLDPRPQLSLVDRYRSFALAALERSVGNLSEFKSNVTRLRDMLYNLSKGFEEQSKMLESAAGLADNAADAMRAAAAQLSSTVQVLDEAEARLRAELERASGLLAEARRLSETALNNTAELEEALRVLNATLPEGFHLADLLNRSRQALQELSRELASYQELLQRYTAAKERAREATGYLVYAASQLSLLASTLRAAADGLRELSRGLRTAADLVDSSLAKMTTLIDSNPHPDSLLEFNRTISSQMVEPVGGSQLRSELMSDAVYVSLPLVKLKRSEPQVASLPVNSTAPQQHSELLLLPLAASALFVFAMVRRNSRRARSAALIGEIRLLRERLARLEGGEGA